MTKFSDNFESFYKKSPDRKSVYNFPPSLKKLLAQLTGVIYSNKADKYNMEYRFLLREINGFIKKLEEYERNVRYFENLGEEFRGRNTDRASWSAIDRLRLLDNFRKDAHNALMLSYIRLVQDYQHYLQNKFPWPSIFFDKDGRLKKDLSKETGEIDLSGITKEERNAFSEWALTMAKELRKAKESISNSSSTSPDNLEAEEIRSYLELLAEEQKKLNLTNENDNEKS